MLFVKRSEAGCELEVPFEANKRKAPFLVAELGILNFASEGGNLGSRIGKDDTKLGACRIVITRKEILLN